MHALVDVHLTTADQSGIRNAYFFSAMSLLREEKYWG